MTDWNNISCVCAQKIKEVDGSVDDSTLNDLYIARYINPPNKSYTDKIFRYKKEIFDSLPSGCSVLIFGSGHPESPNLIKKICPNIKELGCIDRIKEASFNLDPDIYFEQCDILIQSLPVHYDFVFSSHTLEHFTRKDLLDTVIPRLKRCARKASIHVVPYEDAWGGEPSHRCRFHIDDELFCLSEKYKIIHNNEELVLWM